MRSTCRVTPARWTSSRLPGSPAGTALWAGNRHTDGEHREGSRSWPTHEIAMGLVAHARSGPAMPSADPCRTAPPASSRYPRSRCHPTRPWYWLTNWSATAARSLLTRSWRPGGRLGRPRSVTCGRALPSSASGSPMPRVATARVPHGSWSGAPDGSRPTAPLTVPATAWISRPWSRALSSGQRRDQRGSPRDRAPPATRWPSARPPTVSPCPTRSWG